MNTTSRGILIAFTPANGHELNQAVGTTPFPQTATAKDSSVVLCDQ